MATTHYVTGIASWAKVYPHNKDVFAGEESYTIDLSMTEEEAQKFKNTGTKRKIVKEDSGLYKSKFKRPAIHEKYPDFGGPPQVIDASGNPFTDPIGNGSKVTLKYVIYDTAMGKGTRLEKVRVDELVPYNRDVPEGSVDDIVPF